MEKVSLILILLLVVVVCYIIYDSMPSKYTKLDQKFRNKSPLHTIIYGATGTGKTYFFRQYLKVILKWQFIGEVQSGSGRS